MCFLIFRPSTAIQIRESRPLLGAVLAPKGYLPVVSFLLASMVPYLSGTSST